VTSPKSLVPRVLMWSRWNAVSGDQTICEEAKQLLGPIETAAVKQATGFYSATMVHPEVSEEMIRAGVKRAIERRADFKPYKVSHPVKLQIIFQDVVNAEVASYLPNVERPRGDTIVFNARDMVEASKFFEAVTVMRP
jgi:D-amino peptidase